MFTIKIQFCSVQRDKVGRRILTYKMRFCPIRQRRAWSRRNYWSAETGSPAGKSVQFFLQIFRGKVKNGMNFSCFNLGELWKMEIWIFCKNTYWWWGLCVWVWWWPRRWWDSCRRGQIPGASSSRGCRRRSARLRHRRASCRVHPIAHELFRFKVKWL